MHASQKHYSNKLFCLWKEKTLNFNVLSDTHFLEYRRFQIWHPINFCILNSKPNKASFSAMYLNSQAALTFCFPFLSSPYTWLVSPNSSVPCQFLPLSEELLTLMYSCLSISVCGNLSLEARRAVNVNVVSRLSIPPLW